MKKLLVLVGLLTIAPLGLSAAIADDVLAARFDGGIGVQPVVINPTTFVASANVVRGVQPGGAPWVVRSLKARLEIDGEFEARGLGLVLAAAGARIGTRGDLSTVRALVFCGTSNTAHVSAPAALDIDGDFKIEGTLTPPAGPTCPTPTLLIVVGAGTDASPFRWLAAGIPDNDDK